MTTPLRADGAAPSAYALRARVPPRRKARIHNSPDVCIMLPYHEHDAIIQIARLIPLTCFMRSVDFLSEPLTSLRVSARMTLQAKYELHFRTEG